MFSIGSATHIYVAAGATDMRKGFEGLFGLVRVGTGEKGVHFHRAGTAPAEPGGPSTGMR